MLLVVPQRQQRPRVRAQLLVFKTGDRCPWNLTLDPQDLLYHDRTAEKNQGGTTSWRPQSRIPKIGER